MTTPNKVDDNDNETHPTNETTWLNTIQAFLRWAVTPLGFCITIYGLNVVAWGGMLFLLLCNAAPAMCHPSCDDPYSARRIWIEIDSQILNALFCVTGFGLAPWRIRDLYLWCLWRLGRSPRTRQGGLVRLAEIHSKWFCGTPVPVDEDEEKAAAGAAAPVAAAAAAAAAAEAQRTPTPLWKMDVVVWGNILNSVFQVCLAVCMWAMDRFHRPSWTTGLFVGLACLVAAGAGVVMWLEKKRIHKASEHPGALLLVPPSAGAANPGNGYMHLDQGASLSS
ncbi:hypothetical protein ASPACDRAFT_111227 [Aspergillus aculeatus ATCC 16872]|uniref:Uncharacterized protein n=1 Tax=Aspergillus aculeatus (strain ATCC 16872 / CBS 172.66 / WB 5094) TaxID=690307 RepID=A0A1L9X4R5_ASPA1|nr:uncharacterized protein ASPACDRAFT_111227 [Aspergillus aculeatus ATCC 16872]OJK03433.1 hypothetical protein ASPACDRAFT_111227 [Aspergillus aculeatus ATCC 16872]